MGCEFVDIFSSLLSRNMRNVLVSILALLGDMDLIRYECNAHDVEPCSLLSFKGMRLCMCLVNLISHVCCVFALSGLAAVTK